MKRTLSYTITNKNKSDTIGAFLRDAGYSRRILIELKQNPEQICLNGTPSWLNTPLQIGDTLTLFLPDEPVSSDILPANRHSTKTVTIKGINANDILFNHNLFF